MRAFLTALLILGLVLAGCGDDDDATNSDPGDAADDAAADGGDDADDEAATGEAAGDPADDPAEPDETTTTTPDPCVNDLAIVNGEAETATTVTDGPFEAVTMWSEGGPHPDNDIDEDANLDLGFFSYVQEPDPQFGVSIPIASEAPEGEHFLSFSLYNPSGAVAAGQTYIDQVRFDDGVAADGEINFHAWFVGTTRVLPSQPEITITEVNDEQICGEITTRTESDLQQFVGIEGTFAVDRSQHLEALAEADDETAGG